MSKAHPPELKKFMDKKMVLKLNGSRQVTGILRGFDPFMNLVIDESVEERKDGSQHILGMVVKRDWKPSSSGNEYFQGGGGKYLDL
ncbi:probable small nuclear ribonucleoprotein G isoform X1 [Artemia franciscana]|uniref:probable small nuclear ribonucleoprotein G isoform X1 n=1 Tax=Artemia franciscana TaxID=6661 RepID=UPI0032DB690A